MYDVILDKKLVIIIDMVVSFFVLRNIYMARVEPLERKEVNEINSGVNDLYRYQLETLDLKFASMLERNGRNSQWNGKMVY